MTVKYKRIKVFVMNVNTYRSSSAYHFSNIFCNYFRVWLKNILKSDTVWFLRIIIITVINYYWNNTLTQTHFMLSTNLRYKIQKYVLYGKIYIWVMDENWMNRFYWLYCIDHWFHTETLWIIWGNGFAIIFS